MKKGIQIALLIVGVLLLGALILNFANGGIWIIQGLNGTDGTDGRDGIDGVNGVNGSDGVDGADGKSAYELALEDGFEGTLHEWLLSLAVRGTDGSNGLPGIDGVGVKDVKINAAGELIVYMTDGTEINAGVVSGTDTGEGGDGTLSTEPDADGFYEVYETVILTNVEQSLYLRLSPDTVNGEILTSIKKGAELLRVGDQKTDDGLSRFVYNGKICYARSKFFEVKYIYEGEIPTLNLPARVVLTAGEESWFVTDQILPDRTADTMVYYSYSGSGTRIYDGCDGFAITPDATTDTETLTVRVEKRVDGDLRTILEKTVNVSVVQKQTDLALNGLFIGDSRISDGTIVTTLDSLMPNLNLIGTRSVRSSGVLHEGRGAWSTSHYLNHASVTVGGIEVSNAFYDPTAKAFSFAYYVQQHPEAAELDFVVINLGANDSFSEDSVDNMDEMVASIRAYSADIRILIMTEYLSPTGGYYLTQTTNLDVNAMRARQFRYFSYLSQTFEGREDEGIYLVENYLGINGWSDWERSTVTTANGSEERITDVIHLGYAGYCKEAAVLRSYLYWLFGAQTE